MMGGCWYPLELFPPAIQNAVKILPTTWAMEGMLDLVCAAAACQISCLKRESCSCLQCFFSALE